MLCEKMEDVIKRMRRAYKEHKSLENAERRAGVKSRRLSAIKVFCTSHQYSRWLPGKHCGDEVEGVGNGKLRPCNINCCLTYSENYFLMSTLYKSPAKECSVIHYS